MAGHHATTHRRPIETDSAVFAKAAAILLGILVAVLGFFALMLWADARQARDDADAAAGRAREGAAVHEDHNTALPLNSFAGVVPDNAQALAEAHDPVNAALPVLQPGNLVKVQMTLKDMAVEIAPASSTTPGLLTATGRPARSSSCARARRSR